MSTTETKWTKQCSVRLDWEVVEFIDGQVAKSESRRENFSTMLNGILHEYMKQQEKV